MSGNRSKSADAGGSPLLPSRITSPDILVFDVRQLQAILVQSFPKRILIFVNDSAMAARFSQSPDYGSEA
jgi:hypothetical protein